MATQLVRYLALAVSLLVGLGCAPANSAGPDAAADHAARCGPGDTLAETLSDAPVEAGDSADAAAVDAVADQTDVATVDAAKDSADAAPLKATPCDSKAYCFETGRCWQIPGGNGNCVALSDADCLQSEDCKVNGRCKRVGHQCLWGDPSGCNPSKACSYLGFCASNAAGCGPTSSQHCASSERCQTHGLCKLHTLAWPTGPAGFCVLAKGFDCSKLAICQEEGACGRVVSSADPFFQSCGPLTDAHCAASQRCKTHGTCALHVGVCNIGDACSFYDTACAPSKPVHCSESAECAYAGACKVFLNDNDAATCRIPPDFNCATTQACATEGRCTAAQGVCIVGSDWDCSISDACKYMGLCFLSERTRRCEAVKPTWPPDW